MTYRSRYLFLGILRLAIAVAISEIIVSCESCILAQQIKPDTTLGSESSIVKPLAPSSPVDLITGGATRGTNLFHSFEQFSVQSGQTVHFDNNINIQNIISRVTGNSVSRIDGLLEANGAANLFLINPNGIIFGSNASLDIGGSFIASTASSLNLADNTHFSATNPLASPLLTINMPAGLQFGKTAESIVDRSRAINSINGSLTGLKVKPVKTLAFIGGNVTIEGGILVAPQGRIELGSVAGKNLVSLKPTEKGWAFGYEDIQNFKDIQIYEASTIGANGQGGGDVQLQGRSITIADGSRVFATVTTGSQPGGILKVDATDSVELIGTNSKAAPTSLTTATLSSGDSGNIVIDTKRLIVRDEATVSTDASVIEISPDLVIRASGRAGSLTINASNSVAVLNGSALTTETSGSGDAGSLRIKTGQLNVQNNSTISSIANEGSTGKGGDLTIDSRQLNITNGAKVSVSSLGRGNAGDITFHGGSIQLRNNSRISTTAGGTGNGGNIYINSPLVVAIPSENSHIEANAFQGQGGKITIKSLGLFGLMVRNLKEIETLLGNNNPAELNLTEPRSSDITAISQTNPSLSGQVNVTTIISNPSQGLVNLPIKPVNVTRQIAQGCPAGIGPRASKFVVTGRGGTPPDPTEALRSEPTLADLGTTVQSQESHTSATTSSNPTSSEPAPLVEAQGWVTNAKGEVVLVAQAPTVTLHIPWLTPTICQAPKFAS